jgi:hypothetical protein
MIFSGMHPVTTAGAGILGTILITHGVGTTGTVLTILGHGTVAGIPAITINGILLTSVSPEVIT